jgi:hypothetical protein
MVCVGDGCAGGALKFGLVCWWVGVGEMVSGEMSLGDEVA